MTDELIERVAPVAARIMYPYSRSDVYAKLTLEQRQNIRLMIEEIFAALKEGNEIPGFLPLRTPEDVDHD